MRALYTGETHGKTIAKKFAKRNKKAKLQAACKVLCGHYPQDITKFAAFKKYVLNNKYGNWPFLKQRVEKLTKKLYFLDD